MTVNANPFVVTSGLIYDIDAGNPRSYAGTGTTAYDVSGNNNTTSLVNGVAYESANFGSFKFDGVDDRMSVPNSSSLSFTSISVNVWIKFNTFASRQMIAEKHTSPTLGWWFAGQSNKLVWLVTTSSGAKYIDLTNNTTINTGTIYNLTGVYNGSTGALQVYVNAVNDGGTVVGTGTGFSNSSNPMYIGAQVNWSGASSLSNIYQMQIYNTALTATEITQNFNAMRGRYGI